MCELHVCVKVLGLKEAPVHLKTVVQPEEWSDANEWVDDFIIPGQLPATELCPASNFWHMHDIIQ